MKKSFPKIFVILAGLMVALGCASIGGRRNNWRNDGFDGWEFQERSNAFSKMARDASRGISPGTFVRDMISQNSQGFNRDAKYP